MVSVFVLHKALCDTNIFRIVKATEQQRHNVSQTAVIYRSHHILNILGSCEGSLQAALSVNLITVCVHVVVRVGGYVCVSQFQGVTSQKKC